MINRNDISTPPVYDLKVRDKCGDAIYLDESQALSTFKAVEQLSYYMKREFGFGVAMYTARTDKHQKKCHAYIWTDKAWECDIVIGAVVFRFENDLHQSNSWVLEWVWIHPYYRRQGLLSKSWDAFKKAYGDFACEEPLSKEMIAFLEKQRKKNA